MIQVAPYSTDLLAEDIRMAETLIQRAKNTLLTYYDDYADIQEWMFEMEQVRKSTEILLNKHLSKGLE